MRHLVIRPTLQVQIHPRCLHTCILALQIHPGPRLNTQIMTTINTLIILSILVISMIHTVIHMVVVDVEDLEAEEETVVLGIADEVGIITEEEEVMVGPVMVVGREVGDAAVPRVQRGMVEGGVVDHRSIMANGLRVLRDVSYRLFVFSGCTFLKSF